MDNFDYKEYLKNNPLLNENIEEASDEDYAVDREAREEARSEGASEFYAGLHANMVDFLKNNINSNYLGDAEGLADDLVDIISRETNEPVEDRGIPNPPLEEMHITNKERYNYDDPNSPISKLDKDQAAIEAMNSILTKYPIDVIRHWIGCFKK